MPTLKKDDFSITYDSEFKKEVEIVNMETGQKFDMPGQTLLWMVGEGYVKPSLKKAIDEADAVKLLT